MRRVLPPLLALLLTTSAAEAQTPILSAAPPPEHRVAIAVGWDSTWFAGLGYAHRGPDLFGGHRSQIDVAFVLPIAGLGGARLEGGLSALFAASCGLGVATGVHTGLTLAVDSLGTHLGWGLALSARPGYYADRWSIALDLGYRTSLATYVAHSDAVEALYTERYPDGGPPGDGPKDGFYAFASHRLRLGLLTGLRAGDHVGLFLAGGFDYAPQAQGLMGYAPLTALPFYAELGGDYSW